MKWGKPLPLSLYSLSTKATKPRTQPTFTTTPCLRKKLCKFLFDRISSNFHQFW